MDSFPLKRDSYFDLVKAAAILMVVVSHVYGGEKNVTGLIDRWMYNFIILCNMPLFFVISGHFAVKTIERLDGSRLVRTIRSWLWPWVSFAVLMIACDLIVSMNGGGVASLRHYLFQYWFFRVVSMCLLIAYCCAMLFRGTQLRWGLVLLSPLIVMAVPDGKWCLYQLGGLRAMYVWFVAGIFLSRWRRLCEDWRFACPIMLATLFACMTMGNVYTNGLSFYKESSWLLDVLASSRLSLLWLGRLLLGLGGIVSVLWLVYLAKDVLSKSELILAIGRSTLGIYAIHVFVLRYLNLPKISLVTALIISCVLLLASTFITMLINRWSFGRLLVFGRMARS